MRKGADKTQKPTIVVVAGPNGAGKTTFYEVYLRRLCLPFVNADEIAKYCGCDWKTAAELAESTRQSFLYRHESFVFETVFSDRRGAKLAFLQKAVAEGYEVRLIYIGLDSWEQSELRVSIRVAQGGHDVPDGKIRLRYERTLKNLAKAIEQLPDVVVYDNSLNSSTPYRRLGRFVKGRGESLVADPPEWFSGMLKKVRLRDR